MTGRIGLSRANFGGVRGSKGLEVYLWLQTALESEFASLHFL